MARSTPSLRLASSIFTPGATFQPSGSAPAAPNMQGGAAARDMVNLGKIFSGYRDAAPDYGKFGQANIANLGAIERAEQYGDHSIEMAEQQAHWQGKVDNWNRLNTKAAAGEAQQNAWKSVGLQLAGTALGFVSDKRTKHDINPIDDALQKLRELKPVTFKYNEGYNVDSDRLHHGFIAQEYKDVLPDATFYDEVQDLYSIDPIDVIALLVRSVQQLETKVARMEAQHALAGVK